MSFFNNIQTISLNDVEIRIMQNHNYQHWLWAATLPDGSLKESTSTYASDIEALMDACKTLNPSESPSIPSSAAEQALNSTLSYLRTSGVIEEVYWLLNAIAQGILWSQETRQKIQKLGFDIASELYYETVQNSYSEDILNDPANPQNWISKLPQFDSNGEAESDGLLGYIEKVRKTETTLSLLQTKYQKIFSVITDVLSVHKTAQASRIRKRLLEIQSDLKSDLSHAQSYVQGFREKMETDSGQFEN